MDRQFGMTPGSWPAPRWTASIWAARPLLFPFQDEEQVVHFLIHLVDTVQLPLADIRLVKYEEMTNVSFTLLHKGLVFLFPCLFFLRKACHRPPHKNYRSCVTIFLRTWALRAYVQHQGNSAGISSSCSSSCTPHTVLCLRHLQLLHLELALGGCAHAVPLGKLFHLLLKLVQGFNPL